MNPLQFEEELILLYKNAVLLVMFVCVSISLSQLVEGRDLWDLSLWLRATHPQ